MNKPVSATAAAAVALLLFMALVAYAPPSVATVQRTVSHNNAASLTSAARRRFHAACRDGPGCRRGQRRHCGCRSRQRLERRRHFRLQEPCKYAEPAGAGQGDAATGLHSGRGGLGEPFRVSSDRDDPAGCAHRHFQDREHQLFSAHRLQQRIRHPLARIAPVGPRRPNELSPSGSGLQPRQSSPSSPTSASPMSARGRTTSPTVSR